MDHAHWAPNRMWRPDSGELTTGTLMMSQNQFTTWLNSLTSLPAHEVQSWLSQRKDEISSDLVESAKEMAEDIGYSGDLEGSLELLERTEQATQLLSEPLSTALVWRGRANVYQFHERFEDSLTASQHAVSLYEIYGTEFDIAVARTVEVVALGALERFSEAIELAQWIRPHFEKQDFLFGQARLSHALAQVYTNCWRLEDAWLEYERALSLFQKLERPLDAAWLQVNRGILANQMDRLALADSCYQQAYPILVQHDDKIMLTKLYFNWAQVCIRKAQYNEALTYLEQARVELTQIPDSADVGYVDLFEAQVRQQLHQSAQAEDLLQRTVKHFAFLGRKLEAVEALIALSHHLSSEGVPQRLAQSLTYLHQAAEHLTALNSRLLAACVKLEQAELLLRLQRLDEAYAHAEAVEPLFANANLMLRQYQAQVLMADCCQLRCPKKSRQLYRSVLGKVNGSDWLLASRCWRGIGQLAMADGNPVFATQAYVNAIDILDKLRRALRSHQHQAGFAENKKTLNEALLAALHRLDHPEHKVLNWLEHFKAGALADLLINQPPDMNVDEDLRSLLEERENVVEKLDRQLGLRHQSQSHPVTSAPQRGIALAAQEAYNEQNQLTLQRKLQSLDEKIARRNHPAMAWRDGSAIMTDDVQGLLDEETLLISYYEVYGNLYVLTATSIPGDLQIHSLAVSLSDIEKKWLQARRLIMRPDSRLISVQRRLAYFWKMLMEPLKSRLMDKRRLLIVPHRSLFYLPFSALYDLDSEIYVTQRWIVHTTPSASILALCRKRQTCAQDALLVGYPGESSHPQYLPNVRKELDRVSALIPGSEILWGDEATARNVFDRLFGRKLIHLAGHAFFDSREPLSSGMPLAGGRWLRAADLYLHYGKLAGTTVLLSGCNTAGGQARGGDVLGLTSAFLYAGASAVVAGLWRIDDAATTEFMTQFYQSLNDSLDVAEALHQAQCVFLADERYKSPYFWAPFVLSGDSRQFNFEKRGC